MRVEKEVQKLKENVGDLRASMRRLVILLEREGERRGSEAGEHVKELRHVREDV